MTRDGLVPIKAGIGSNPRRQILVLRGLLRMEIPDHMSRDQIASNRSIVQKLAMAPTA